MYHAAADMHRSVRHSPSDYLTQQSMRSEAKPGPQKVQHSYLYLKVTGFYLGFKARQTEKKYFGDGF